MSGTVPSPPFKASRSSQDQGEVKVCALPFTALDGRREISSKLLLVKHHPSSADVPLSRAEDQAPSRTASKLRQGHGLSRDFGGEHRASHTCRARGRACEVVSLPGAIRGPRRSLPSQAPNDGPRGCCLNGRRQRRRPDSSSAGGAWEKTRKILQRGRQTTGDGERRSRRRQRSP